MSTDSIPPSILVLGAGELGNAVLSATTSHPFFTSTHPPPQISVLLRPNPSADRSALTSQGISIVTADISDASVDALAAVFAPFDTVVSCTGFVGGAGTQTKITEAALQAGVRRFFPWQFGVDYDVVGRGSAQDLFDEQYGVREVLRGQGRTEWVIVSTGMFMSFLFEEWWGVVETGEKEGGVKVRALGSWENRITVTEARDIGRVVAELVLGAPEVRNEVVHIAGDTASYGQVADLVERVLGRPVERNVWSVEYLEEELKKEPQDELRKYRVVFGKGKGVSWEVDGTWNVKRGLKMMSMEDWVRANLKLQ